MSCRLTAPQETAIDLACMAAPCHEYLDEIAFVNKLLESLMTTYGDSPVGWCVTRAQGELMRAAKDEGVLK